LQGLEWVDAATREVMLFAAAGLFVGGLDDLAVDACFAVRRLLGRGTGRIALGRLALPADPLPIAIFVPAWDEARVIGPMLDAALARLEHPDYRLYVGLYPNDPDTVDAAAAVAERDPRVRLVIGTGDGPTTKADNLNVLWRALMRDAAAGWRAAAVVLHDAEDVVHPAELRVFDALLRDHDVIQLPVLPLVKRGAALVSGHYADEFAEAHGKALVVRTALGAGMPLAGTGCAIAVPVLARVAGQRGGDPFDAQSLVEDYELGLRLSDLGARGLFAQVRDGFGTVAVRSLFPATLGASVRQKARWMTGIALAGWDRTGWATRRLALGDHWFRLRDRRAPLAVLVLAAAYGAMMLWGVSLLLHWLAGDAPPAVAAETSWLIAANALLLGWRLLVRMSFTARVYGPVEALWAAPRFLVGNYVALAAAPRALVHYWRLLGGAAPVWDKTRHDFPDLAWGGELDWTRPVGTR